MKDLTMNETGMLPISIKDVEEKIAVIRAGVSPKG